jgi:hypothetical protein
MWDRINQKKMYKEQYMYSTVPIRAIVNVLPEGERRGKSKLGF